MITCHTGKGNATSPEAFRRTPTFSETAPERLLSAGGAIVDAPRNGSASVAEPSGGAQAAPTDREGAVNEGAVAEEGVAEAAGANGASAEAVVSLGDADPEPEIVESPRHDVVGVQSSDMSASVTSRV